MALILEQSLSVVFPAHNEEANIVEMVEVTKEFLISLCQDWEIIVVNDGSSDRTGEIADDLSAKDNRITIIHNPKNLGYGGALKAGLLASEKDLVFFTDADLQFHISEIILLLNWIEQYDMVIGYRQNRKDHLHRKINAFGWNILVRLVLGLKVKDIDCAFKLFRRSIFIPVQIDAVGAMVNTDILVQAIRMGFKVKEVPVSHFPRKKGEQSGAKLRVIINAFRELFFLYKKLKSIDRIVFEEGEDNISSSNPSTLPLNVEDRRKRYILHEGTKIPLYSSSNGALEKESGS